MDNNDNGQDNQVLEDDGYDFDQLAYALFFSVVIPFKCDRRELKRRCSVRGHSVCLNRKFQCDGIVGER